MVIKKFTNKKLFFSQMLENSFNPYVKEGENSLFNN